MKRIISLVIIAAAALALGCIEAFGTGPLPEDRVFTPGDRHALAKMREATKVDQNFLGDPGYLLGETGHSSASGADGTPCFDERGAYFGYELPPPLFPIGFLPLVHVRHRIVSAAAPEVCYDLFGNATARKDLWEATSYQDVSSCFHVEGDTVTPTPATCSYHAWVPVAEEPPVPTPLPPGCYWWPFAPGYICFPFLPPNGQIEDPWAQ